MKIIIILLMSSLLSACIPTALTGGPASSVQIAADRRPSAVIINDRTIEKTLSTHIKNHEEIKANSHIVMSIFNENVLLLGQVPTQELKDAIEQMASNTPNVKHVYNELTIGPVTGLVQRTNDNYLSTRIKTRIIRNNTLGSLLITVITERNTVYLIGIVTTSESDQALEKARSTKGVKEVVYFFDSP